MPKNQRASYIRKRRKRITDDRLREMLKAAEQAEEDAYK